jgi:hypothetical protein
MKTRNSDYPLDLVVRKIIETEGSIAEGYEMGCLISSEFTPVPDYVPCYRTAARWCDRLGISLERLTQDLMRLAQREKHPITWHRFSEAYYALLQGVNDYQRHLKERREEGEPIDIACVDGRERARINPGTFEVPDMASVEALEPGDFVKVIVGRERFWVKLLNVSAGKRHIRLTGRIDNDLVMTDEHGLQLGDTVRFQPQHVIDIITNKPKARC